MEKMEISDFVYGFENTKILGVSSFGFITGGIAGLINFDEKIEKSKRKVFSKDSDVEKKYTKLAISAIAGVTSINYNENILSDISQGVVYTALFRLGYETGYQVIRSFK